MMEYKKIRDKIEAAVIAGNKKFIIYPFGEMGSLTKRILNESFGIRECYICDNKLSKINPEIKGLDYFKELNVDEYTVLFTCADNRIYREVYSTLRKIFPEDAIVECFSKENYAGGVLTQCGKYSAGPLCNHMMVESVGAFCTFAPGTDAVENHPIQYISTHFFMYGGTEKSEFEFFPCYDDWERINPAYFDGITPKGKVHKFSRSVIGNDVWLGKNVIITNGANIGNGVIAAAGAIITKDVPDYAIVAGVPAKIIRYRYTQEQINKLNAIAWWNWSDDKIRKCYDDFFENVDIFIQKHK